MSQPFIVREACRFRRTLQRPEDLVATFRGTGVHLECVSDPPAIPVIDIDGVPWLPVFSDLAHLAAFLLGRGEAGSPAEHLLISGGRLLDLYLPGMPAGTTVILDPLQPHAVVLPPLTGIVPESIAIDRDLPGGPARPTVELSPYERPVERTWGGVL
ncbi:hypothetical protein [Saccharopolyspora taberi]|uniref:hypothetical protein n=1 Tax=Saccharopolyspora taberi TaxID=60895 RepID=UPI0031D864C4